MTRLLIALTVAALAFTGCKSEETKDEKKEPEKTIERKAEPKEGTPAAADEGLTDPEAKTGADPGAEPVGDPSKLAQRSGDDRLEAGDPPKEDPATATETAAAGPVVVLETNLGVIKIELTPERTPITVENFLRYVNDGFFPDTIFHRVVPGFVIQGGGFTEDFTKKETRDAIENEAAKGIKNVRGTISMARTRDRNSATSQFFISLSDNPMLDYHGEHPTGYGYAAFGQVIEGMDVVDEIAAIPTVRKGPFPKPEVPSSTVLIKKAYVQ
ncbi:MAG: peptidylprolyl isomerase [Pseudomonadota bacterium]